MPELNDSILGTTKKLLQIAPDYTEFDLDIITHINSVFFELNQLGIGPTIGFAIADDSSKWQEFIGVESINAVKSFMGLKVRMLFDPPTTSFALDAMTKQAEEMAWRLNIHMEGVRNPWPIPPTIS